MKRKITFLLTLILLLSLFTACNKPEYPREVNDYSFDLIRFKDAVISFLNGGQTIKEIKEIESPDGDPYYMIVVDDVDGGQYATMIHGWSGYYATEMVRHPDVFLAYCSDDNYSLIFGRTYEGLVCIRDNEYICMETGEKLDEARIERLKNSAAGDHAEYVRIYKERREKLDEEHMEEDMAFLIGHTVSQEERVETYKRIYQ